MVDGIAYAGALDAVRASYDRVANDYAAMFRDELVDRPVDRALLVALAELAGDRPVIDAGCGPGTATAVLRAAGADVAGIDLSPGMVEAARRRHPDVPFSVGSMLDLRVPDGWLGGLVSWFSIIHTPVAELPTLFAEFCRVLAPGGHVLLAFQVRDADQHVEHAFGHPVTLEAYRQRPDEVEAALVGAGFTVTVRLGREPLGDERAPRAFLIARRER